MTLTLRGARLEVGDIFGYDLVAFTPAAFGRAAAVALIRPGHTTMKDQNTCASEPRTLAEAIDRERPGTPAYGRLTLDNVDRLFDYQPWDEWQRDAGQQVREALTAAAKVILRAVPPCPTRTRALNDLLDARMKANAAITFRGEL